VAKKSKNNAAVIHRKILFLPQNIINIEKTTIKCHVFGLTIIITTNFEQNKYWRNFESNWNIGNMSLPRLGKAVVEVNKLCFGKGRKTRAAAGAAGELCPSQIYYFQRQNSVGGSKFRGALQIYQRQHNNREKEARSPFPFSPLTAEKFARKSTRHKVILRGRVVFLCVCLECDFLCSATVISALSPLKFYGRSFNCAPTMAEFRGFFLLFLCTGRCVWFINKRAAVNIISKHFSPVNNGAAQKGFSCPK